MFNMSSCVALEAKAYLLRVNILIPALLFQYLVAELSGESEKYLGKRMKKVGLLSHRAGPGLHRMLLPIVSPG